MDISGIQTSVWFQFVQPRDLIPGMSKSRIWGRLQIRHLSLSLFVFEYPPYLESFWDKLRPQALPYPVLQNTKELDPMSAYNLFKWSGHPCMNQLESRPDDLFVSITCISNTSSKLWRFLEIGHPHAARSQTAYAFIFPDKQTRVASQWPKSIRYQRVIKNLVQERTPTLQELSRTS